MNIGLVAHDYMKNDMVSWVHFNENTLKQHIIHTTGTTGKMISEKTLITPYVLKSGPFGGDQQIGAMIAEGKLDMLIFFIDTMTAQPHDVDIKALIRLAALYNIPSACNRTTADFIISSTLFSN